MRHPRALAQPLGPGKMGKDIQRMVLPESPGRGIGKQTEPPAAKAGRRLPALSVDQRLIRVVARTLAIGLCAALLIVWKYSIPEELRTGGMTQEAAVRTTILFATLVLIASVIGLEFANKVARRRLPNALVTGFATAAFLWVYALAVIQGDGGSWPVFGIANLELFRGYQRLDFILDAVPLAAIISAVICSVVGPRQ